MKLHELKPEKELESISGVEVTVPPSVSSSTNLNFSVAPSLHLLSSLHKSPLAKAREQFTSTLGEQLTSTVVQNSESSSAVQNWLDGNTEKPVDKSTYRTQSGRIVKPKGKHLEKKSGFGKIAIKPMRGKTTDSKLAKKPIQGKLKIDSSLFKAKIHKTQKPAVVQKNVAEKKETISPQNHVLSKDPKLQGDKVKLQMYDPTSGDGWITSYNQLTPKGFLGKITPKERVIISPPNNLAFLALEGKVMISNVVWKGIHQLVGTGCGNVYLQLNRDNQYYQVNTESRPFGLIPVESNVVHMTSPPIAPASSETTEVKPDTTVSTITIKENKTTLDYKGEQVVYNYSTGLTQTFSDVVVAPPKSKEMISLLPPNVMTAQQCDSMRVEIDLPTNSDSPGSVLSREVIVSTGQGQTKKISTLPKPPDGSSAPSRKKIVGETRKETALATDQLMAMMNDAKPSEISSTRLSHIGGHVSPLKSISKSYVKQLDAGPISCPVGARSDLLAQAMEVINTEPIPDCEMPPCEGEEVVTTLNRPDTAGIIGHLTAGPSPTKSCSDSSCISGEQLALYLKSLCHYLKYFWHGKMHYLKKECLYF